MGEHAQLETIVRTKENTPKILWERELLTENHRKLLRAIDEKSPFNLTDMYRIDFYPSDLPTIRDLQRFTKLKKEEILLALQEIKEVWDIPDDLPTGNGKFTQEQALLMTLGNQHRTRWDDNIEDYRVKQIQIFNGEVGTGSVYVRKHTFKGEALVREAMGWNPYITAYHISGGNLPEFPLTFGLAKKERAKLVGNAPHSAEESQKSLEQLVNYIELAGRDISHGSVQELSKKDIKKIKKNVVDTASSYSDLAKAAGGQIAPALDGLPNFTSIIAYSSYDDRANRKEILELQIAKYRNTAQKVEEANRKLPKLVEDISGGRIDVAKYYVNLTVGELVAKKVEALQQKLEEKNEEMGYGAAFRSRLEKIVNGNRKSLVKKAQSVFSEKSESESMEMFYDAYSAAVKRYSSVSAIMEPQHLQDRIKIDEDNKNRLETKLGVWREKKDRYQTLVDSFEIELQHGHGNLTKKVQITPAQTKALEIVAKEVYKSVYDEWMDVIRSKTKRDDLNLHYISDPEISFYVPEAGELLGREVKRKYRVPGKIITSIPQINRQDSNMPIKNSVGRAVKSHEAAIASRIARGEERSWPLTEQEARERKYHLTGFSDIVFTSHGADGFHTGPKISLAPTRVKGEYRGDVEITYFIKTPTRHNFGRLQEVMKKGNGPSWPGKRFAKGGPTSGNIIFMDLADGSQKVYYVHDDHYEAVEQTFGKEYRGFKKKFDAAKTPASRNKYQKKMNDILEQIKYQTEVYLTMTDHDIHLGAFNMEGRPTNVEYTVASTVHMMQSYGFENIKSLNTTEILNGAQSWRAYDSRQEGRLESPTTAEINRRFIRKNLGDILKQQGVPANQIDAKILDHIEFFSRERDFGKATFILDEQEEMFLDTLFGPWEELLDNKIPIYIGDGNHIKSGNPDFNESTHIANLFHRKYRLSGLVQAFPANGQSFTIQPIALEGKENQDVYMMFLHKMWHGNTEGSNLSNQSLGHRDNVQGYILGDRHHPWFVYEQEKTFWLTTGKQGVVPYVAQIGKSSSTRGTVAAFYNPLNNKVRAAHFVLDPVVDNLISWKYQSKIMETNYEVIKNSERQAGLAMMK